MFACIVCIYFLFIFFKVLLVRDYNFLFTHPKNSPSRSPYRAAPSHICALHDYNSGCVLLC